jgi:glycosyltransferase involved in cell wall biosynthesis
MRGLGRHSLDFTRALATVATEHEIWLLLSGAYADSLESVRAEFAGLVDARRIVTFGGDLATRHRLRRGLLRRKLATARAEAIVRIEPDIVHIPSLFEHGIVVSPVGQPSVPTVVTVHDLIPLAHRERYLAWNINARWYYARVEQLKRAHLLLAVSEYSRLEAINLLGVPPDRVITVGAGVDPRFRPIEVTPAAEAEIRARFGLDRPFIMFMGGAEWRKNVKGLFAAFALIPPALRSRYQLAIVWNAQPIEAIYLTALARRRGLGQSDVVLKSFISDDDLVRLYNLCHFFICPSHHEGFGLPALEAMACGAPVIGSNTTNIPAVIDRGDALFDPTRPQSIADAMQALMTDEPLRQSLARHGPIQAARFTWTQSANSALKAFAALAGATEAARQPATASTRGAACVGSPGG